MFAVLANIFNFGVVELFLQKVEFLHEIFFFFFFPEQLESGPLQHSGLSPRAAQGKRNLGYMSQTCPVADCALPGSPHPRFPSRWRRLQMTHRNHVSLCPLTKPIQTRNEIWQKPSQKAAEGRVVLKSALLGEPGLYFS